jgi:diaminopimelate decarboxylase
VGGFRISMDNKLKELYKSLVTPCYILDKNKLDNNYDELFSAFTSRWEKFIVGYSFKTNSLPWILKYMKSKGAYAEVVSETEYKLAMKLGFEKDKVVINGPYKGFDALRDTLEDGAIVNLDSFHEIEWIKNNKPLKSKVWNVGIRINFNLEEVCNGETIMGMEPGRFGFNIENGSFQRAIEELDSLPYVRVVGIHGHHSTKTKSLNVFKVICNKIVEVCKDIKDNIEYIDVGGCIFGDKPGAPSFKEYADTICDILENNFDKNKVTLILEPGAALIASPFKYLCKVIDSKDVLGKRIVTTDGSAIHIDPQMHEIKFFQQCFGSGKLMEKSQIISGFTCIEKDRMAIVNNENELNIDDYILFHNTGAYSMALSPLFIQYYPAVYAMVNGGILMIRKPWTVDEYLMNSCDFI